MTIKSKTDNKFFHVEGNYYYDGSSIIVIMDTGLFIIRDVKKDGDEFTVEDIFTFHFEAFPLVFVNPVNQKIIRG